MSESFANKRILLVENDPDQQALAVRALQAGGIASRIEIIADGRGALSYLQQDETRLLPHLMLLDIHLGDLDGHEVLAGVRADPRTWHLPVVVLTTSMEPADIQRSYRLGANGYLRKPMRFEEFTELLSHVITFWLRYNVNVLDAGS